MAITLPQTRVSVNLGNIVDGAIEAAKAERKKEAARTEAEFQKAIADGSLGYDDQIKFRERQLEDEKKSGFIDDDVIENITQSITSLKKLNRFNKYRSKYAEALGELSSGKINEVQYLDTLRNTLSNIEDPELRLEVQGDIVTAEQKVKQYNDTILTNQVKKAKYDGTQGALDEAISRVKTARAQALISDNKDEVTAYDETLGALDSQLSTVRIQDSLTEFQVRSSTRGVSPMEKLTYINDQLTNSNPNQPIRIGDRTYQSAQQFWTLERDSFLSGSSQIFGNFFDELQTYTKNAVDANTAKFGYPTQAVLDDAINTFNSLKTRPEIAPFVNKLDITQATVMSDAVDKIAKVVNAVGVNNLTFKEADTQLKNIGTKYGIDVTGYRLQLDEQLRNLARSGIITEGEAVALAPDVQVELPKITPAPKPTIPGAPAPTAGGKLTVKSGDTLSAIAKKVGISLSALLDLNPQFKANPNLIRVGENVNLPGAPEPTVPETPKPIPPVEPSPTPLTPEPVVPPPAPGVPPPPAPGATPPQAPQPPVTPTPPTPTPPVSTYTGSSIVDYLKSTGQDSSYETRKKLAGEKGIQSYAGTADQNTQLLKLLRGQ